MDNRTKIEVTPQAWLEMYQIMYRLMGDMAQWSEVHDLPVQISLGALAGLYDVIAEHANACDCDACHAVEDAFANELRSRMMDTSGTVH